MKKSLYEYAIKHAMNRRSFVKGAASAGAIAAMGGGLSSVASSALADGHSELRKAILKIPGVGVGSPGDADWQKVGEMVLGGTKERVKEVKSELLLNINIWKYILSRKWAHV